MLNLIEIAKLFLKLGLIAFGGPAAHIAMFEDEVVTKRNWMDRQYFLDLVGATNLIPGPNSTEMALHIGYHKGKLPGLMVAGLCFMTPAILLTGFFAYLYILYGNLQQIEPFFYGIKPAVIIIVLNAVYKLGKKAIKGWKLIVVALGIGIMNFIGLNEILSIILGGIFGTFFLLSSEKKNKLNSIFPFAFSFLLLIKPVVQIIEKSEVSLTKLFLTFLKIGSVWFGSGYILVAYFNGELVQGLHWLTRKELLDAIAVGQFTPGPFLSSATFIGYQIAGISGAILATIGIVIHSILFVLILNPLVLRLRKSSYLSNFLDAVNVSSLAVMAVVALKLGAEVLIDWKTIIIAVSSAVAFFAVKKINSAYIVLGGALLGYVFTFL